jgi:hypothetical protein
MVATQAVGVRFVRLFVNAINGPEVNDSGTGAPWLAPGWACRALPIDTSRQEVLASSLQGRTACGP